MGAEDLFRLGGREDGVAMRAEDLREGGVVRIGVMPCDEVVGIVGDQRGADVACEGAVAAVAHDVMVVAGAVPLVVAARALDHTIGVDGEVLGHCREGIGV